MHSYTVVSTQADMEQLLDLMTGFHDSMTKEIHLMNRGAVLPNQSMMMGHSFDAQVLIQSQWEPFAVELLFTNIKSLQLGDAGEYWGASGIAENKESPVIARSITMKFDADLRIVSENLRYRVRRDWLGHKAYLGSEVPSDLTVPSTLIQEDWRQCPTCSDAWQAKLTEEISRCPSCGALTQLQNIDESGERGQGLEGTQQDPARSLGIHLTSTPGPSKSSPIIGTMRTSS